MAIPYFISLFLESEVYSVTADARRGTPQAMAAVPQAVPALIVSLWRMSACSRNRPDLNQAVSDTDRNRWGPCRWAG